MVVRTRTYSFLKIMKNVSNQNFIDVDIIGSEASSFKRISDIIADLWQRGIKFTEDGLALTGCSKNEIPEGRWSKSGWGTMYFFSFFYSIGTRKTKESIYKKKNIFVLQTHNESFFRINTL